MLCSPILSNELKALMENASNVDEEAKMLLAFWNTKMAGNDTWKLAHDHVIEGKIDLLKDFMPKASDILGWPYDVYS